MSTPVFDPTITRDDIDLWEREMAEWLSDPNTIPDTPFIDNGPPDDDDYDPHGDGDQEPGGEGGSLEFWNLVAGTIGLVLGCTLLVILGTAGII